MLLEVYKCVKKVNAPCLHNLFNTNTIPNQLRTSKREQPLRKTTRYVLKNVSYVGSHWWNSILTDHIDIPHIDLNEKGLVTMIVPASGHQVRCIPWVQMGTFNKEIGFLCGLRFFALNIFCGEYLQSSLHVMLQIWWKPLLWKMCQWIMMRF